MAQGIQIPQNQPNAPQFQPPTDLINAYMARRQQDQQFAVNSVADLGKFANTLSQQKLQNNMAQMAAHALAIRQIGPDMANQIYGGYVSPNGQGGTAQQPQTPQQQIPPPGTPQNATLPLVQDKSPSQAMALSAQAGHPMHPALAAFHNPQSQDPNAAPSPQGQPEGFQSAPLTDLSGQMKAISDQIPPLMDQGERGAELIKERQAQIQALAAQQTAANAPEQFAATEANAERRFQQGKTQEKNSAIAGKGAEQKPAQTQVDLLQSSFDNLDKDLSDYYKSGAGFGSGNINEMTLGRAGSKEGGSVIKDSNLLITTLNRTLTNRFGMVGQDLLSKSLAVTPNDTPQRSAEKMKNIHQIIQTLDSANKQQIQNYIATINGQSNGK